MSKPFVDLFLAAKREIKKSREDSQYVLLSGETHGQRETKVPCARDEDSDASDKSPAKKMDFLNKYFKSKAKNSDDEATISSVYDQCKGAESDSSLESKNASNPPKGVVNRKKKRTLAYYDNKIRQQLKPPVFAKVRPSSDKSNKNKKTTVQDSAMQTDPATPLPVEQEPKAVVTLLEDKECILEQFDPLWVGTKKEDKIEKLFDVNKNKPLKPPRNKIIRDNVFASKTMPILKIPELKVAKMEAIQENEFPNEEETTDDAKEHVVAKASVSYEGLEGVFATPIIEDHSAALSEVAITIGATGNAINSDLSKDLAGPSYSEALPVFVQPRKNPWNAWPGSFGNGLGMPAYQPHPSVLQPLQNKPVGDWLKEQNEISRLNMLLYETTEEEQMRNRMIENFFAEEARVLNERDIAEYSAKIEISKIEIYEEDIKRYHQGLKYRRGPIDHDIIYTTVETALNFIEKLTKEREQKKKVSFLPELLEKCLKSKAKREKEKEEEEKKKREKEEKKKGPQKPKMWLVFNRLSKEKVIICTPGEFYDSD